MLFIISTECSLNVRDMLLFGVLQLVTGEVVVEEVDTAVEDRATVSGEVTGLTTGRLHGIATTNQVSGVHRVAPLLTAPTQRQRLACGAQKTAGQVPEAGATTAALRAGERTLLLLAAWTTARLSGAIQKVARAAHPTDLLGLNPVNLKAGAMDRRTMLRLGAKK